jgi:hypothetical protein
MGSPVIEIQEPRHPRVPVSENPELVPGCRMSSPFSGTREHVVTCSKTKNKLYSDSSVSENAQKSFQAGSSENRTLRNGNLDVHRRGHGSTHRWSEAESVPNSKTRSRADGAPDFFIFTRRRVKNYD